MKFASYIKEYVEHLLRNNNIGLCAGNIAIGDKKTGSSSYSKQACIDRFKLAIPYGGQFIHWEVLFNEHHPEYPPDFIFDPSFRPSITKIEALKEWEPEDPSALLKAIQQLVTQYRKKEASMLESYSRLQFEYSSLLHTTPEENIEVSLINKNRNGQINFLIKLDVDLSKIPPYMTQENLGKDAALLLVIFHTPDGSRVTPQLLLSPRVENALGGSASLRIPGLAPGECLMDYIPAVCEELNNRIESVVFSFERRKELVAAFLSHFGKGVVEYDAEMFHFIALLIEWRDFYFLLHISMSNMFPHNKPLFTFQSIYHTTKSGGPYCYSYSDYPFSPRWTSNEMVLRTKAFLLDYIPIFQWMSIENKK